MSEKAEKFLANGQEVVIGGKLVKIERQTIRHNLKFIQFIGEVMAEANELGTLEFTKENVVNALMGTIETKLVELAGLIVPGIQEDQVLDSYFDEWANVLEVYMKLNFFKVYQAGKAAMAIQNKK